MIINGMQIDETEVLDCSKGGTVFTVRDLIDYVINNPGEFESMQAQPEDSADSTREIGKFYPDYFDGQVPWSSDSGK